MSHNKRSSSQRDISNVEPPDSELISHPKKKAIAAVEATNGDCTQYIKSLEEAMKTKGCVSYLTTQSLSFGPPNVGKSVLYHCLVKESRVTHSNVVLNQKNAQLTNRIGYFTHQKTLRVEDVEVEEIPNCEDEIALYLKTALVQSAVSSIEKVTDTANVSAAVHDADYIALNNASPPINSSITTVSDTTAVNDSDTLTDNSNIDFGTTQIRDSDTTCMDDSSTTRIDSKTTDVGTIRSDDSNTTRVDDSNTARSDDSDSTCMDNSSTAGSSTSRIDSKTTDVGTTRSDNSNTTRIDDSSTTLMNHSSTTNNFNTSHMDAVCSDDSTGNATESDAMDSSNGLTVCGADETNDAFHLDEAIFKPILGSLNIRQVNLDEIQALTDKSVCMQFSFTDGQPEFHEILPALVAGPTIFFLCFNVSMPLNSLYEVEYGASSSSDLKSYKSSFIVKDLLMQCLSSISDFRAAQLFNFKMNSANLSLSRGFDVSEPPVHVLLIGIGECIDDDMIKEANRTLQMALKRTDIQENGIIEEYDSENRQLIIPVHLGDIISSAEVKNVVARIIRRNLDQFRVTLPVNWLYFRLYLMTLESSILSYSECIGVAEKFNMPEEELQRLLYYLHYKTGTIRYYGCVPELKDIVFIKPSILFTTMTQFVTSTFTPDNVMKYTRKRFQQYGLFKMSEIKHVFDAQEDKFGFQFQQFAALLKYLHILDESHDPKSTASGDIEYFFPYALPYLQEANQECNFDKVDPLLISFSCGFCPGGVFSGLLKKFHEKWEIKRRYVKDRDEFQPMLYRNQATFRMTSNNSSVTFQATSKLLRFSVKCEGDDNPKSLCREVKVFLKTEVKRVFEKLNYVSKFCDWKFGLYCSKELTGCEVTERHFAEFNEDMDQLRCSRSQEFMKLSENRKVAWFIKEKGKEYSIEIPSAESTKKWEHRIEDCIHHAGYKGSCGIIFVIGMYGAPGSTVDVKRIQSKFEDLNFAVHTVSNPTASEIYQLVKAAGSITYPSKYKFVALYYAGHGGIDDSELPYIIPQTSSDPSSAQEILYIYRYIIEPLRHLSQTRIFLFDCCQNKGKRPHISYEPQDKGTSKKHPGEVIAFAASKEQSAVGDTEDGGLWTYVLCDKLAESDKPITSILLETADIVAKKRSETQRPMVVLSISSTLSIKPSVSDTAHQGIEEAEDHQVSATLNQRQEQLPPLSVETVYRLLKSKASKWFDIGLALGVDRDYRNQLQAVTRSDYAKLEDVIAKWVESCYPVTEENLIDALKDLQYQDIIDSLLQ